ncbi:hypothetical protein K7I13_11100 [Brucepastera parasyntrophica]|uniref:hypothetical protein n=1 Tax=Brucepastera parasyntrophica TaxID=2880008 RepID=UPI00210F1C7D|nr:hypothetical protein [Brucepastera parasyntrophica]ULQ59055.1 hypothetical protein K7I13_11100 [Brucepastera parasyntrophica]
MTIRKPYSVFFRSLSGKCMLVLALVLFAGCSSAPKRPAEILTTRNLAIKQLDLANKEAERGNYDLAQVLMDEAWRMAVSTDDPSLRVQVQLSQGNLAFYTGDPDAANNAWDAALAEAQRDGDKELVSVAKIYRTRGELSPDNEALKKQQAEKVITTITAEMGNIKKANPLFTAYAWVLTGFAQKDLGRWSEAEKSVQNAASIHEKERYLELAAYDWYVIASIRSMAGQYASAVTALQTAIEFDRRAENTFGLGMDWMATGDVQVRAGNISAAKDAYQRASDIFASASFEQNAAEADRKLNAL